jgi:hypothetical protein
MRRKRKSSAPPSKSFSGRTPLADDSAKEIGLLNQAMPIISERIGSDEKAHTLVRAAEDALNASKRMSEEPEILDHYISEIAEGDLDSRFAAVLVFSFALTSSIEPKKAVEGLEKALMDDDETMRQMALESLVEYHWIAGNFHEIDILLKIPQLLETVTSCLWSASIRLDDSQVPLESRRYLRSMMIAQADSGNKTAKLFLEEVRRMSGLD